MNPKSADFPDWFGPMLVKELRQGLKTRGFVFSFIGLQMVLVFALIYNVLVYARNPQGFDASDLGVIFWLLLGGLLIFVTPLRAFNELAAERKANTLELIFMSGLSAWRIAFGKWISLLFQALLFLLAVLPYAILRYYFGAVDLAQDLRSMLLCLLACAVLSAVALAISGMAIWVRILVMILAGLFIMFGAMWVPMLMYGGSGFRRISTLFSWTDDVNWWLVAVDTVLVCLVALQIGAATVAPAAENHHGAQRFLSLLLWLPLPIMRAMHVSDAAQTAQLSLFTMVAGLLIWYQLSVRPSELRSHCRPFRGWRAIFGVPFQPGWPSAVIFLLIEVALYVTSYPKFVTSPGEAAVFLARSLMSSAALLCSTFVWVAFRPRARFPLLFETLFTILCWVAIALITAGKPTDTHFEQEYWFGFIPAMATWVIGDSAATATTVTYSGSGPVSHSLISHDALIAPRWTDAAYLALAGYALLLLIWSRHSWVRYFRTCFALARPAPEPIPATTPSEP